MIHASICTIGNEILIGQVVDTNSSRIASALEEAGIRVTRMVSFGDDRAEIMNNLRNELTQSDIVITTGGLGPTKDDMTKAVLAELSGSTGYVEHAGQLAIIHDILHSRGLDMLEINRAQALVPERLLSWYSVFLRTVSMRRSMPFRAFRSRPSGLFPISCKTSVPIIRSRISCTGA